MKTSRLTRVNYQHEQQVVNGRISNAYDFLLDIEQILCGFLDVCIIATICTFFVTCAGFVANYDIVGSLMSFLYLFELVIFLRIRSSCRQDIINSGKAPCDTKYIENGVKLLSFLCTHLSMLERIVNSFSGLIEAFANFINKLGNNDKKDKK